MENRSKKQIYLLQEVLKSMHTFSPKNKLYYTNTNFTTYKYNKFYCRHIKQFFPFFFGNLSELREGGKKKGRGRESWSKRARSSTCWFHWPGMRSAEDRGQELHLAISCMWQQLKHLGHLLLHFQVCEQKAESEEGGSQYLIQHSSMGKWWLNLIYKNISPHGRIFKR